MGFYVCKRAPRKRLETANLIAPNTKFYPPTRKLNLLLFDYKPRDDSPSQVTLQKHFEVTHV